MDGDDDVEQSSAMTRRNGFKVSLILTSIMRAQVRVMIRMVVVVVNAREHR